VDAAPAAQRTVRLMGASVQHQDDEFQSSATTLRFRLQVRRVTGMRPEPAHSGRAKQIRRSDSDALLSPARITRAPTSKDSHDYQITISKKDGMKLGVDLVYNYDSLTISFVKAGGLVSSWNDMFPDRGVMRGDRIVEVNGVRGDAAKLDDELVKATELTIKLLRNPKNIADDVPTYALMTQMPTARDITNVANDGFTAVASVAAASGCTDLIDKTLSAVPQMYLPSAGWTSISEESHSGQTNGEHSRDRKSRVKERMSKFVAEDDFEFGGFTSRADPMNPPSVNFECTESVKAEMEPCEAPSLPAVCRKKSAIKKTKSQAAKQMPESGGFSMEAQSPREKSPTPSPHLPVPGREKSQRASSRSAEKSRSPSPHASPKTRKSRQDNA